MSPALTGKQRQNLWLAANPRRTKGLPGFLPLYVGMRLLLQSKDCVLFGLMKGCEVVLEHTVFADEESLPEEVVADELVHRQYMPATLVLRDVGKPWVLTGKASLDLPPLVPRRAQFQLQPSTVYIRQLVEGRRVFHARCTQFAV